MLGLRYFELHEVNIQQKVDALILLKYLPGNLFRYEHYPGQQFFNLHEMPPHNNIGFVGFVGN